MIVRKRITIEMMQIVNVNKINQPDQQNIAKQSIQIKLLSSKAHIYLLPKLCQPMPEPAKQPPHQDEQQPKKVPTTKEELIAMLKEQLDKVQDDISQMQQTLQDERQKRKELTQQLQEKQLKIQELLQNQSKTLGDKVNEGLYNTLQAANKIRAQAQSDKRTLTEDNIVLNQKITHRDSKVMQDRELVRLNSKKVHVLELKKTDLIRKQQNVIDKKQQTKKKLQMMKKEHERIQREEFELRNHLENMKKLRLYLNKNLESGLKNLNANVGKASRVKPTGGSDNFWN